VISGRIAALLLVCSHLLPAQQVRSSVVLGGVRVRYADALDVNALILSPAVTVQSGAGVLGASGTFAQPTLGPWSAQGQLSGSYFRSFALPFALEAGGLAGGSTADDGTHTGHAQAVVRGHMTTARTGAWVGGGVGRAWSGTAWQPTRVAEIGLWTQGEIIGLVASHAPTVANDSVRYADTQLSLRLRGARFELDGVLGRRGGAARAMGVNDPTGWGSVSASLRVSARMAIVASGGTYPLDLLQGFPSGRFVSMGVRLTGPGSGPSPEFARSTTDLERDRLLRAGVGALGVRRVAQDRYELRLRASGAARMEVTGDLTGWEPVAMRAGPDGWWSIVLDGAPGTYELTVRRDGGAWVVPPGLLERRDEFGGVAGSITLR
jgi:hypothetical protein